MGVGKHGSFGGIEAAGLRWSVSGSGWNELPDERWITSQTPTPQPSHGRTFSICELGHASMYGVP